MSNLFDFLEWRGDLTFSQDPFHDLDALVMTQISYFTLEEIMDKDAHMTIAEAWEKMKDGNVSSRFVQKSDKIFFEALANSTRYKDLEICHVAHKLEEEQNIQFAAMTILLPDGTPFLAYRGTDMSLVGWKEDLYMAFSDVVPAQTMALAYLEKRMAEYQCPMYLGGHSKGGNLALYAATVASKEIQDNIKMIYVHDGPGLTEELFHGEGYARIKDRLQAILPDQSMVGVLMMHPEEYSVVKSTANSGVLQHNPYTWEVLGTHYVLADGLRKESYYVETVTKKWVEENGEEELRDFVESMFGFLKTSDADSLDDVVRNVKKNPRLLFQAFRAADADTQKAFKQTMSQMAETAFREATSEFREATSEMREKGIDRTKKKLMELLPGKSHEGEVIDADPERDLVELESDETSSDAKEKKFDQTKKILKELLPKKNHETEAMNVDSENDSVTAESSETSSELKENRMDHTKKILMDLLPGKKHEAECDMEIAIEPGAGEVAEETHLPADESENPGIDVGSLLENIKNIFEKEKKGE